MSARPTQSLPEGWEWVRLGEICHTVNQRKPDATQPQVMSISKYDGFVPSLEYFSKQVFSKDTSGYKYVKDNQFAYSTIHLDEGSIARFSGAGGCLISPMYTTFGIDDEVDGRFLLYLLKSDFMIANYAKEGQGSVNRRKSVPFETFTKIFIPLPPLPVQRWIADVLANVDEWLERENETIEQLRNARTKLINQVLSGFSTTVPLGNITASITSGSRGWAKFYADDGANFFRIGNVTRESIRIDSADVQKVALTSQSESARTKLKAGDILISITADLGRVAVYENSLGESYVNQHIAKISLKKNCGYSPDFIATSLSSDVVQQQFRSLNDSSAKAGLNLTSVKNLKIHSVPAQQQENIVHAVLGIENQAEQSLEKTHQIYRLRSNLLHQLLSGTLQPQGGWASVIHEATP